MKAQKGRGVRLVKADSQRAEHNRRQAQRIPTEESPKLRKRKAKKFNTFPISNEDQLMELKARLVDLEGKAKCAFCPPEVLESLNRQAKACRKAIRGLMMLMAGEITSPEEREKIKALRRSDQYRDTKAKAKVPKTAGRGLRGKPEPYDGPGKPTNKIPVEGKPTIFRVEPEGSPDRMKFNRPQRPESVERGFRTWNSGAVKRKKGDDGE